MGLRLLVWLCLCFMLMVICGISVLLLRMVLFVICILRLRMFCFRCRFGRLSGVRLLLVLKFWWVRFNLMWF